MFNLLEEIKKYKTYDKNEENSKNKTIEFLKNNTNCYSRTNLSGHITAGGFVADKNGNILLNHHNKTGMWFQFGGHSDGNDDSLDVAKREIMEEAGIVDLTLISNTIFDINDVQIDFSQKKNEPAHVHYDINFLFFVESHDFKISNESMEIKWVTIKEARNLVNSDDIAMLRMIDKYEKIIK